MEDRFADIWVKPDLEWAREQFRELPDGEYGMWELGDHSDALLRAAAIYVGLFLLDQKKKPQSKPRAVFRGEEGDQVLDARTHITKNIESRSANFIFIVQNGEVVEVGEDMTGTS